MFTTVLGMFIVFTQTSVLIYRLQWLRVKYYRYLLVHKVVGMSARAGGE